MSWNNSYQQCDDNSDMQLTGNNSQYLQTQHYNHHRGPSSSSAFALNLDNLGGSIDLDASYEVSATGTLKTAGFEIRPTGLALATNPIQPSKRRSTTDIITILPENHSSSTSSASASSSSVNSISPSLSPSPMSSLSSSSSSSNISLSSSPRSPEGALDSISTDDLVELGELGKGACGVVRRALHIPTCKLVALKTVNVFDKDKRRQLVKELEILTTFNSPYLVSFHGAYYSTGITTLVLEYMNRNSLSELVKLYGPLNELMLMRVAVQVIRALALLHSHKKIHRDIKPGNLLINHAGCVKMADFGILTAMNHTHDLATTFVGTTMYMSPERVENQAYGPPSDIWSVGVTLYYLAVGSSPYSSSTSEGGYWGLVKSIRNEPAPSLPASLPFSSHARDFIDRCVRKAPEERATAAQLLSHPWIAHADELWNASVKRDDPNPLANRKDSDTQDLGNILNIVLDKYYPNPSYKRSLFELARFQQISLSLGVEVDEVTKTFEKMYCIKFGIT